ncbi:MAG: SpaA isopeptide-forming pilin-related protein, partial [Planctomycetota bacterium]|nr:SpaA isopeptide-forming pilin-related protein [Planctomycetota bacterium]
AGFNGVNNNFGEILASSISGYVYVDANNDGNFGGGESGIQSVTVTLSGTDDLGNSVSLVASTNAAGFYSFGNLRPGTYALTESQPAGYLDGKDTIGTPGGSTANDAFSAISLAAGFNGVNNNFGEILASSISGYVYSDTNNDGNFGGGESGITGATVTLSGTDDLGNTVSRTTTTNGSGLYTFANLRPGTYTLTESQPAGYLDGKDTIGTPGGSTANDVFSSISLPAGFNGVNNNFGELLPGSISGFVYCDSDNNGLKGTSELGIGGVTVRLTGTNDLGASVTITAVTNAAGAFSFTGLRPGTYVLTETQPANTVDGLDRAGSAGGTAGNDVITAIAIGSGQDGVNYLFGEICLGTISGTKYRDLTGNGLSSDDTGMGGVRIYIDANNNGNFDANERSTITAANGTWSFVGANAGTYIIREVVPTGFVRTFPTTSDNYCFTLSTGQVVTGLNFANFEIDCSCDLTSYSFTATRADGSTATFGNLRGNTNQGEEIVVTFTVASTVTTPVRLTLVSYTAPAAYFDANTASLQRIFEVDTGLFGPGTHTLRVHNPDSHYQIDFVCGDAIVTFGPAGSNIFYTPQGRLISADNDGTVSVISGAGMLSGNVYFDNNNDGIRQANEAGIAGTTVSLTFTDGTKTTTLTKKTDSRGFYFFSNLKPGLTYTINESQPLTLIDGIDSVGSLGGNGSVNDRFSGIALTAGSSGINYNFGERAVSGNRLATGDTATIGYWNNNNGQALIRAMNGSQNSTSLGNWLAANFPNLFGANAGTANMAFKSNSQVAAFYKTRFSISGVKIEAQIMAAALACYVTSSNLAGGNFAAAYGFNMSAAGTGSSIISSGSAGSLFGIANNASLTVIQYLTIADANASNNGRAWNNNSTARSTANTLFTNINETGDIV